MIFDKHLTNHDDSMKILTKLQLIYERHLDFINVASHRIELLKEINQPLH